MLGGCRGPELCLAALGRTAACGGEGCLCVPSGTWGSHLGVDPPGRGEQCHGLGTCSVHQWQGWSHLRAALRGWHWDTEHGDCRQSCGETVVCARSGGKRVISCPFSVSKTSPFSLPWRTAIPRCWVLWGHLFGESLQLTLQLEESLIEQRKKTQEAFSLRTNVF